MGETMSKRLKLQLGGEAGAAAAMEDRSFPNPFPDYEAAHPLHDAPQDPQDPHDPGLPFLGDRKISPTFARRIQSKIQDLLQQMEEGLKTADPHDCSAYTGWTGIALLYLQLYRVTSDQAYLLRSLDYVKRTLRNLNGRRITFLCGDAGPLAVGAVVYHKLKSDSEAKECIAKLLQLQRTIASTDSDLPDELLYGRAGYLYALLYLNTEIGPDTVPQSTLREVVSAIIESGKNLSREERKTERCPLLYQWHRKQYVGAAHGMAGIYYVLMQPASNVDQETLTELLKPSIDYVRHKKFRSGNYPSSLSNETDRLVHWCHGAPGVIHMLLQAYKTFKEEKYLKDAMECSDVIWQRGLLRKGYGICHGTAGNGYSFLSLYHLTQDKKYLYRACKFAEWCLDYGAHGCRIPDRPYSLFEGMGGTIHFLSDVLAPETSRFPALELGPWEKEDKEEKDS
ncbi:lanC-like protein 2 [Tachyglossus aculeatus]|uniref:lanC-like protein 2 n=1 Tax=Tachyglossus aculeatus TaxID=9261 RepID=UPI0018F710E4|nr:lanC-like protein 2 [Tachyglossus aculeatus]XP_038616256.1 lanC-like protein 2 [Tachyglossus aculeatus]XP_038616257.1 lanC-like protein 2 [Tachyglossus aculeatus]